MLRITVNLPDTYRPLLDARIRELRRAGDSHYGRCLIDDDLGLTPVNHRALADAAERAADAHALHRSKARPRLPKSSR